jgi:hypothetical protein
MKLGVKAARPPWSQMGQSRGWLICALDAQEVMVNHSVEQDLGSASLFGHRLSCGRWGGGRWGREALTCKTVKAHSVMQPVVHGSGSCVSLYVLSQKVHGSGMCMSICPLPKGARKRDVYVSICPLPKGAQKRDVYVSICPLPKGARWSGM